jgi:hypothetical protein
MAFDTTVIVPRVRPLDTETGVVSFSAASYSGNEGTTIPFTIERALNPTQQLQVDWVITGVPSASPSAGRLRFNIGDLSKTVNVTAGLVAATEVGSLAVTVTPLSDVTNPPTTPSAVPFSVFDVVTDTPPVITGTPSPIFTQGIAAQGPSGYDMTAFVSDDGTSPVTYDMSPEFPTGSGLSFNNASGLLEYDGVGPVSNDVYTFSATDAVDTVVSNSFQVVIASTAEAEADWQLRSTAPGVFFRHNFTYKDINETQNITSQADLLESVAQYGNPSQIEFDQTIQKTGNGCLKHIYRANQTDSTSGVGISFDGIGASSKNTSKHEFYFQFMLHADSVYRSFNFGSGFGAKMVIIQAFDRSFEKSEIVIYRTTKPGGGLVSAYRFQDDGQTQSFSGFYPVLSEYTATNFINRNDTPLTTATGPAATNLMQQKHGLCVYSVADTSDPDIQHLPFLAENDWTVFEVYVKQVADTSTDKSIVKLWMADYGEAPELVLGAMDAELAPIGTRSGGAYPADIYSGFQLTTYSNPGSPTENWPSVDTFLAYDELICSDDPIPFPGGHELPYTGQSYPPGYPWQLTGDIPQASPLQSRADTLAVGASAFWTLNDKQDSWDIQWTTSSLYYDSNRKEIQYMGKAASGQYHDTWGRGTFTHYVYEEVNDVWLEPHDPVSSNDSQLGLEYYANPSGHIWCHTFDEANGSYIWAEYGTSKFWIFDGSTRTWRLSSSGDNTGGTGSANQPNDNASLMCFHPNLFGSGAPGIVIGNEYGRWFGYDITNDTWSMIQVAYPGSGWAGNNGSGRYIPAIDSVIVGTEYNSYAFRVAAGAGLSSAAVTEGLITRTVNPLPIPVVGAGGGTWGHLLNHPEDSNKLLLIESGGSQRVWDSTDYGDNFILRTSSSHPNNYLHPFKGMANRSGDDFMTMGSLPPQKCVMAISSNGSGGQVKIWKPGN